VSVITKLTRGKGHQGRVNVFLDGRFSFSLLAEVAQKEGLRVNQELSADRLAALARSDNYQRCYNAATRFLGCRPRSEAEIRQRLQKHGYDTESTEKVLARLKEQGLADDASFARFWKENRETFSPRSRWLTRMELQRKGLDPAIVEEVAGEVDDTKSAYRAALRRVRRLMPAEYRDFRRRLGDYLRRRGFGYEVINNTVEKVWKECGSSPGGAVTGQFRTKQRI
jgi:regulatory protein